MRLPVPLGIVNETLTEDTSNTLAVFIVGEFGFVITEFDVLDATDVPVEFVAVTVNV